MLRVKDNGQRCIAEKTKFTHRAASLLQESTAQFKITQK